MRYIEVYFLKVQGFPFEQSSMFGNGISFVKSPEYKLADIFFFFFNLGSTEERFILSG